MNTYKCACMQICRYAHVTLIKRSVHGWMDGCVAVCMNTYKCACLHICRYAHITLISRSVGGWMDVCVAVCMNTYKCACMRICRYAHVTLIKKIAWLYGWECVMHMCVHACGSADMLMSHLVCLAVPEFGCSILHFTMRITLKGLICLRLQAVISF